ncbi:unnamed protein product [Amoebophrya sp. A120]|nr:unnamed protein product [Amoebophrya sp. A120]|eukprot:GSA120T00002922001.1
MIMNPHPQFNQAQQPGFQSQALIVPTTAQQQQQPPPPVQQQVVKAKETKEPEVSFFARKWKIQYGPDTLEALAIFREDPRVLPWVERKKDVIATTVQPQREVVEDNGGLCAQERLSEWLHHMQLKTLTFTKASSRAEKRRAAEHFDPVNVLAGIGIEVSLQRIFQFTTQRMEICKTLIQLLSCIDEEFCPNLKVEAYSIGLVRLMENILYVLVASCIPSYRVSLQRVLRHMVIARVAPHIARNRLEVAEFFLKRGMQKLLRERISVTGEPQGPVAGTSKASIGINEGSDGDVAARNKLMNQAAGNKNASSTTSRYDEKKFLVQWRLEDREEDVDMFTITDVVRKFRKKKPVAPPAPPEVVPVDLLSSSPDKSRELPPQKEQEPQQAPHPNSALGAGNSAINEQATFALRSLMGIASKETTVPHVQQNEGTTTKENRSESAGVDSESKVAADTASQAATSVAGGDLQDHLHGTPTLGPIGTSTSTGAAAGPADGDPHASRQNKLGAKFREVPRGRARAEWWGRWRWKMKETMEKVKQGKWAPMPAVEKEKRNLRKVSVDYNAFHETSNLDAMGKAGAAGGANADTINAEKERMAARLKEEEEQRKKMEEVPEDADQFLEELSEECAMDPVREAVMKDFFRQKLEPSIKSIWGEHGAWIRLFGSCVNGFMTKSSDLDCGIRFSPDVEAALDREAFWCDWRREFQQEIRRLGTGTSPRGSSTNEPERRSGGMLGKDGLFDFMSVTRGILVGLRKLAPVLEKQGFYVERVENARIPLLRCEARIQVEEQEQIVLKAGGHEDQTEQEAQQSPKKIVDTMIVTFDISCGHQVVFENSNLLRLYSQLNPKVKQLALIIKHWAKERGINDSLTGTLSSYSYNLLLIHFLQKNKVLPVLQSSRNIGDSEKEKRIIRCNARPNSMTFMLPKPRAMDNDSAIVQYLDYEDFGMKSADVCEQFELDDSMSLAQLLEEFFFYYAYDFDFWINMVSVRGNSVKKLDFYGVKEQVENEDEDQRQDQVWGLMRKKCWLSIEDPFEIDRILGTNAKGQERLTYECRRAYEVCRSGKLGKLAVGNALLRRNAERDFNHPIQALISYDKEFSTQHWLAECTIGLFSERKDNNKRPLRRKERELYPPRNKGGKGGKGGGASKGGDYYINREQHQHPHERYEDRRMAALQQHNLDLMGGGNGDPRMVNLTPDLMPPQSGPGENYNDTNQPSGEDENLPVVRFNISGRRDGRRRDRGAAPREQQQQYLSSHEQQAQPRLDNHFQDPQQYPPLNPQRGGSGKGSSNFHSNNLDPRSAHHEQHDPNLIHSARGERGGPPMLPNSYPPPMSGTPDLLDPRQHFPSRDGPYNMSDPELMEPPGSQNPNFSNRRGHHPQMMMPGGGKGSGGPPQLVPGGGPAPPHQPSAPSSGSGNGYHHTASGSRTNGNGPSFDAGPPRHDSSPEDFLFGEEPAVRENNRGNNGGSKNQYVPFQEPPDRSQFPGGPPVPSGERMLSTVHQMRSGQPGSFEPGFDRPPPNRGVPPPNMMKGASSSGPPPQSHQPHPMSVKGDMHLRNHLMKGTKSPPPPGDPRDGFFHPGENAFSPRLDEDGNPVQQSQFGGGSKSSKKGHNFSNGPPPMMMQRPGDQHLPGDRFNMGNKGEPPMFAGKGDFKGEPPPPSSFIDDFIRKGKGDLPPDKFSGKPIMKGSSKPMNKNFMEQGPPMNNNFQPGVRTGGPMMQQSSQPPFGGAGKGGMDPNQMMPPPPMPPPMLPDSRGVPAPPREHHFMGGHRPFPDGGKGGPPMIPARNFQ